ncbi:MULTISPECIES: hypothetical protein [Sinorhizobium]|uniref:hypothetical protein n=1 Tax=Sinorhizobium TaxID=28105 RepID=UPI0024B1C218|nr:hypothetical protein [Sinorhizobium terangae]WFU51880.1 hypothetical protein QA637_28610 [Sinorhizobium terangae]
MSLEIKFEDAELEGFSAHAKDRLKESVRHYGERLIGEANRLEAGHNLTNNSREVTHSMVEAATTLINHGAAPRRRSPIKKLTRIASQALPLIFGLAWDAKRLSDLNYAAFLFILFGLAIAAIIFANLED